MSSWNRYTHQLFEVFSLWHPLSAFRFRIDKTPHPRPVYQDESQQRFF